MLTKTKSPLRWGLLAASGIAHRFAGDLQALNIPITAVASRDKLKAEKFAQKYAIPHAYQGYQALLEDTEVDAVYISLPNHMHAEWTIAAARKGKHVLCEKPFEANPKTAENAIREVEKHGVFFMEAFMYRCHPQWKVVREWINQGKIGEVRLVESRHSYNMGLNLDNIRLQRDCLGGALMDVGCYCVSLARWVTQQEPCIARATGTIGALSGVDEWLVGSLAFPNGVIAGFSCGSRVYQPQFAGIFGDLGHIEIPMPWHPAEQHAKVSLITDQGNTIVETGDGIPLFARQALQIQAALERGSLQCDAMNWADTLGQVEAIAALRDASGSR